MFQQEKVPFDQQKEENHRFSRQFPYSSLLCFLIKQKRYVKALHKADFPISVKFINEKKNFFPTPKEISLISTNRFTFSHRYTFSVRFYFSIKKIGIFNLNFSIFFCCVVLWSHLRQKAELIELWCIHLSDSFVEEGGCAFEGWKARFLIDIKLVCFF